MTHDEHQIFLFLKQFKKAYVAGREVARRAAGRRRFHSDPEWAKVPLLRMVERDILETDPAGHFRIKPPPEKKRHDRNWVAAPAMANLLASSGKNFEGVWTVDEEEVDLDEYYRDK
ncbi:MAG: hypothetical protein RJA22_2903 [Verrucomicrobiota bacterium]